MPQHRHQTFDQNGNLIEEIIEEYEASPPTPTPEEHTAAIAVAARLAVTDAVRSGDLDDATVSALAPLYDPWWPGVDVAAGDVLSYDGTLVECIQPHTTQDGWEPDLTPALWKVHRSAAQGPQPWVQPQGAHDAYQTGEQVTHNGRIWQSTADNNTWAPGVYGWTDIGPA